MTTIYVLSGALLCAVAYIFLLLWRFEKYISSQTRKRPKPIPPYTSSTHEVTYDDKQPKEKPKTGT